MSEHLHHNPEHNVEHIDTKHEEKRAGEQLSRQAEQAPDIDKNQVEHLQHKAEHEAISGKETTVGEQQETSALQIITKGSKNQVYRKTIKKIRAKLSFSQKELSRLIHQPTIEKASNVGAQTVARSSGILGGAIFAFLGSVSLLLLSKRYGFTYNYLIFFVLFIGGFAVGLVLELLLRIVRLLKR